MITVCQPFSKTAPFHLLFDSLMLESVCLAFMDCPVYYLTDSANAYRMKNYIARMPGNLIIKETGVPEQGARRLHLYIRLLINLFLCRRQAEKLKPEALIYLAFDNITCYLHLLKDTFIREYYIVHNNFHRSLKRKHERYIFNSMQKEQIT